jgi:tetratricopeptide (TPR) repeat protein
MAQVLALRVVWDDTIVEDKVMRGGAVRIGAGPYAQIAAPGAPGRYVTLRLRGSAVVIQIDAGAADSIEFPGEEAIELDGKAFSRVLEPPFRSGRLVIGRGHGTPATIEFERVATDKAARDRALWAWASAAAVLALLAGSTFKMVRLFGEGDKEQWGKPKSLNDRDATMMRVRIGPDGLGASRPQAGQGVALAGLTHGRLGTPLPPNDAKLTPLDPPSAGRPLKKKPPPRKGLGARPPEMGLPSAVVVTSNTAPPVDETSTPRRPREDVIADAQSALLQADLRKAIDSFSHASKDGPLDYDQHNWLGLAHYLSGQYAEAEKVWQEARALDPSRPDAINNLASVAKRLGALDKEKQLLEEALKLRADDCHASNSLALAQAKGGAFDAALATLARSDASCGGDYAYTHIQKAAILSLKGDGAEALKALETGLGKVDTLIPIKEFEVWTDLRLDPAFATLRTRAGFDELVGRYLPRAATWKTAAATVPAATDGDETL